MNRTFAKLGPVLSAVPWATPYGASLMAVIPAKAGIQYYEFSGFRIKCGMTIPQIISDRTPGTFRK